MKKLLPNLNVLLVVGLLLALIVPVLITPTQVYAASDTWDITQSTDDVGGREDYHSLTWTVNPAGATNTHETYYTGLRYQTVNIPKDATITEAYITFTAGITAFSGTGIKTTFAGEDTDDAATWSTAGDYNTRWAARTSAEVDWDDPALTAWSIDTEYQSPDLSTIIQEIVNRAGWSSGNDLAIFWNDKDDRSTHAAGNLRYAYTWDSDDTKTPELYVAWSVPPTVTTSAATSVSYTTATGNGNITDTGSDTVTSRGFQWGTTPGVYPTNVTEAGSFGTGAYSLGITGLPDNTTIYHRAEAYNGAWGYGAEFNFTTLEATGPTVTTGACLGFGNTWAVLSGTIDAVNDSIVSQIGVDYGLTDSYGYNATTPAYMTTGDFSIRIDGLTPGTQYYWRPKAVNEMEWGVGNGSTFHTSGSDTLYEYWNTSDDADKDIYGGNWTGQTFTTGATVPHTITQARVKLFRVSTPGTLTAEIYRTSGGQPTGLPLTEGTIDGDGLTLDTNGAWYTIAFDEEVPLNTGTVYAVVLSAVDGSGSAYVSWMYDSGNGYAGGAEVDSTDGGISWSTISANDMMFEIWGNPVLRILGARVFKDFLVTDDQLFVFPYQAIFGEDYIGETPQDYFHTQLVIESTLHAQGKLPAWGYKPGSIYLDPDNALPWGSNQTKVRLTGISGSDFDGDVAEYILTSSDWIGVDLNALDDWAIATGRDLEEFYQLDFVLSDQEGRESYNVDGGRIFNIGVPGLVEVRSSLFGITTFQDPPDAEEGDNAYQDKLRGNFGDRAVAAFEDISELTGTDGEFMGAAIWFWIIVMGIGLLGITTGSASIGLICGLPLLFIGNYLGVISLVYTLIPTFLFGIYALAKMTIWRA